jgi:phosphatidate phosphatase APP1
LKPGDALVLFPATAHRSEDGRQWVVPVHAWVYVPQKSQFRRTAMAELLKLKYGLEVTPDNVLFFDERVNMLLADNKSGRTIVVDVAGTRADLPPTRDNGHTQSDVRIPITDATPEGAPVTVRAVLPASAPGPIETKALLVGATGTSIISDIDDTVKITHVLDRRGMWEHTFYKPFEAVNGMAATYGRLSGAGVPIHYVSSSPWHLAPPLLKFMNESGLPVSSLSLKYFRLKDRTRLNILKPGRQTKPPEIEAILARYPGRRFILIGDSGEDDPEVYADALKRHPDQIARIFIRNITEAKRDDARFSKTFAGIKSSRWALFTDPAEIEMN